MTPRIFEGYRSGLLWEALDRATYVLTETRLRLFDLICDPEPAIPTDEKREADRKRLEPLPIPLSRRPVHVRRVPVAGSSHRTLNTPSAASTL
jgi:hypothetical protein